MTNKISGKEARRELEAKAREITENDIQKVLGKEREIESKVAGGGPLKQYIDAVRSMFALVKTYWSGEHRSSPWYTIAAIVAALLYVFSPVDLIPDTIPFVGLLDDALVVAACLAMVKQDLESFEVWRAERG